MMLHTEYAVQRAGVVASAGGVIVSSLPLAAAKRKRSLLAIPGDARSLSCVDGLPSRR
jgi:hypothetical protein